MEVSADRLEGGGLLRQVSVVFPGLTMRLDLGDGDSARVRVLGDGFGGEDGMAAAAGEAHSRAEGSGGEGEGVLYDEDSWSDASDWSEESVSGVDQVAFGAGNAAGGEGLGEVTPGSLPVALQSTFRYPCLRLVADTEVVVVPKPRPPALSQDDEAEGGAPLFEPSAPLRVHPSTADFSSEFNDLSERMVSLTTESPGGLESGRHSAPYPESPPPHTVCVHPRTLSDLVPGWEVCLSRPRRRRPRRRRCGDDAEEEEEEEEGSTEGQSRPIVELWKAPPLSPRHVSTERPRSEVPGSNGSAGMAGVVASEHVPHGHIVLHKHLRYQLNLNPLYDAVRLRLLNETQAEAASSWTERRIRDGTLSARLVPTIVVLPELLKDGRGAWRHPQGYPEVFPPVQPLAGSVQSEPKSLWAGMGSPLAPLSSGSLFVQSSFPCEQNGGDSEMYTLQIQASTSETKDSDSEASNENGLGKSLLGLGSDCYPSFVFLDDLPSLLQHVSCDTLCQSKSLLSTLSVDSERLVDGASTEATNGVVTDNVDKSLKVLPDLERIINLAPVAITGSGSLMRVFAAAGAHVERALSNSNSEYCSCKRTPDGLLVTGEEGTGKTHLMLSVAASLRRNGAVSTVYRDCKKVQASDLRMKEVLDELTGAFRDAAQSQPSLLLLDGLDSLVPNVEASGKDNGSVHHMQLSPTVVGQVKVLADSIRLLMENTARYAFNGTQTGGCDSLSGVAVIGSCRDASSVSSALRRTGIFSSVIEVPALTRAAREQLFDSTLGSFSKMSGFEAHHGTIGSVNRIFPLFGKTTEGYRPQDVVSLALRLKKRWHARVLGREPGPLNAFNEDLDAVIRCYVPIAHRGIHMDDQTANSGRSWSSIGGLFHAKQALTDIILHPVRYNLIYQNSPVKLPRGILLYGPSGCGKTYIVPALARECNFNLVTCHGPELLDKYIGASEANVRRMFARAYAAAPAILFLDDFDALAPRRGTDHTGVTDRVVNQLLTFLDGVEDAGRNSGMVYIVAATSRPDKIDPALLRPGRLEKHIFLGYPSDSSEWTNVFSAVSQSAGLLDFSTEEFISSGRLLDNCGQEKSFAHIKSFSAADMKAVLDTAYLEAVHDHISSLCVEESPAASMNPVVHQNHLLRALEVTRPSLLPTDRVRMRQIFEPFYKNKVGGLAQETGIYAGGLPLGDFHDGKRLNDSCSAESSSLFGTKEPQPNERRLNTALR